MGTFFSDVELKGNIDMALMNIECFSECLMRRITFKVILPNDANKKDNKNYDRPTKLLMLLHGYCCTDTDWIWNSQITCLAEKYNICVVLPNGENSFYLDGKATGRKYSTLVGEELPNYVINTFGLSKDKKDHYIGGFSMGGFGAIHAGIKYDKMYSKLFALSSALIPYELVDMQPGTHNGVANYEYFDLMFDGLDALKESENHPEILVRNHLEKNIELPEIYMACGTEDFLLDFNRRFENFLTSNDVKHTYVEDSGSHDYGFWNKVIEPSVEWLLKDN